MHSSTNWSPKWFPLRIGQVGSQIFGEVVVSSDSSGLERRKQPKVPTIISYKSTDFKSFAWGAQSHKNSIEGFNLLLESPQFVPVSDPRGKPRKLKRSIFFLVADFLRALHDHAMERISTKFPKGYLDNDVQKKICHVSARYLE